MRSHRSPSAWPIRTRVVMPSLRKKTLRRWYSTVLALMNNRAAISALDAPSLASRAICSS